LTLAVNVSHEQRGRFEAALSAENGRSKWISSPRSPMTPAAAAPWYSANVYTTTGAEAAVGFDAARPGAAWSVDADLRDMVMRAGAAGRVLASAPLRTQDGQRDTQAITLHSPVFVHPRRWAAWNPAALQTGAALPLPYCTNATACSPSFSRVGAVDASDGVSFSSQMTPVTIPLYGLRPEHQTLQQPAAEVVSLCYPAAEFEPGDSYETVGDEGTQSKLACPSALRQNVNQQGPFIIAREPMLRAGTVIGSLYVDRVAEATLRRCRVGSLFVVAAEDVTNTPGFEFGVRSYAPDAWITATPSASWEASVILSNGTLPRAPYHDFSHAELLTVETSQGTATLQQSTYSPSIFRYAGSQAFGSGRFIYAMAPRAATQTESGEACSQYVRADGGANVSVCAPNLTPAQYAQAIAAADFSVGYLAMVGDRLWRLQVTSGPGFAITHTQSTFALAGGLVTAALLTALAIGAVFTRRARVHAIEERGAARAHEITTSYASHAIKNPAQGISASAALLAESLQELDEHNERLLATAAALSAARRALPRPRAAASVLDVRDSTPAAEPVDSSPFSSASDVPSGLAGAQQSTTTTAPATALPPAGAFDWQRERLLQQAEAAFGMLQAQSSALLRQVREDAGTIESATEALHTVVNDFVDLQRLRTGRFKVSPKALQLRPAIVRTVDIMLPMARVPVVLYVCPTAPSSVVLDPLRLQQCLSNGIVNACTYATTPGSDIRITVGTMACYMRMQRFAATLQNQAVAPPELRSVPPLDLEVGRATTGQTQPGQPQAAASAPGSCCGDASASALDLSTYCPITELATVPEHAWYKGRRPDVAALLRALQRRRSSGDRGRPKAHGASATSGSAAAPAGAKAPPLPNTAAAASAAVEAPRKFVSFTSDLPPSVDVPSRIACARIRACNCGCCRDTPADSQEESPAAALSAALTDLGDGYESDWLVIDVSDNGVGLSGRTGQSLFEPFLRGGGEAVSHFTTTARPRGAPAAGTGHRSLRLAWQNVCAAVQPHARIASGFIGGTNATQAFSGPDAALTATSCTSSLAELTPATGHVSQAQVLGHCGAEAIQGAGTCMGLDSGANTSAHSHVAVSTGTGALPVPSAHVLVHLPSGYGTATTSTAGATQAASLRSPVRAESPPPLMRASTGNLAAAVSAVPPLAGVPSSAAKRPGPQPQTLAGGKPASRGSRLRTGAPQYSAARKGTGLGLALTASLVERMGGYVALAEFGGRTHFIMLLPCPAQHTEVGPAVTLMDAAASTTTGFNTGRPTLRGSTALTAPQVGDAAFTLTSSLPGESARSVATSASGVGTVYPPPRSDASSEASAAPAQHRSRSDGPMQLCTAPLGPAPLGPAQHAAADTACGTSCASTTAPTHCDYERLGGSDSPMLTCVSVGAELSVQLGLRDAHRSPSQLSLAESSAVEAMQELGDGNGAVAATRGAGMATLRLPALPQGHAAAMVHDSEGTVAVGRRGRHQLPHTPGLAITAYPSDRSPSRSDASSDVHVSPSPVPEALGLSSLAAEHALARHASDLHSYSAAAGAGALSAALPRTASRVPPPPVAHVAVFEDDRTNQRLVQRMLQRIGCSCDLFEDGDMAVAAMEATGQLQPSSSATSPREGGGSAVSGGADGHEICDETATALHKPYDFVLMVCCMAIDGSSDANDSSRMTPHVEAVTKQH
jgi:signal transduction histidine kinase/CheY-like chemotaxis protein